MKIRIVSSKEEINSLEPSEKLIHLAFRPSITDIISLVQTCPNAKAIHIPASYIKTISNSTRTFLDMQGIALLEGDVWGLSEPDLFNPYPCCINRLFISNSFVKKEKSITFLSHTGLICRCPVIT